ncbi:MAG: hypothetical protein ABFC24_08745 [Methanoregulaceae archaeon]
MGAWTRFRIILFVAVILAIAGRYVVYPALPPEYLPQSQPQNHTQTVPPTPAVPASAQTTSPVATDTTSTQDPGSRCNGTAATPRILVPVDTSIPIRDPMPGIRYSLNKSDSGRTILLGKGDIVEINLGFAPSLDMRWTVPVSGCGLELVNDGNYYTGGDYWNNTGYYRARYRAVSPGTSVLAGKLVTSSNEYPAGTPRFNLTVIME